MAKRPLNKWKYRILFTLLSIPCVLPATALIVSFYKAYIRPPPMGPGDWELDVAYGTILVGILLLILFPILGYKIGKRIDLS